MTHTLVGATPGSPPVAAPAFAPATPEARQHRRDPHSLAPWLFLAPTLAAGLLFYAVPAVFLVWLSLADWDGFVPPGFAGLKNYVYLLGRDPRFLPTLGRTLVFVAGVVLATVPLALLLANLTYRAKVQALWRVVFCLPMVTHVVAVGYVGRYLFDGTHGAVSRLLDLVGVVGPDWLTRPGWAMAAVVLMYAWTLVGQNVLLFLAGLESIDESLHEAARLDGATAWQRLRHVTLPLLRPATLFAVLTTLTHAVSAGFVLILVMTEGGPLQSTTVTPLYMYETAFADLRLGRAVAMAVLLSLVVLAVSMLQLRVGRQGGVEAWGSGSAGR